MSGTAKAAALGIAALVAVLLSSADSQRHASAARETQQAPAHA